MQVTKYICSSLDFGRAVRVLSHIDRRPELLAYVLRPADAAVSVDIPGLVPLLRPAVADVVQQVLVAPRDFQKEFAACHLWQHVAREEAGAAYEVRAPMPAAACSGACASTAVPCVCVWCRQMCLQQDVRRSGWGMPA